MHVRITTYNGYYIYQAIIFDGAQLQNKQRHDIIL